MSKKTHKFCRNIMKLVYAGMLLMLMLTASCTSMWPKKNNYILDPGLLAAYMDYEKSLKSERPELLFKNGKMATNCLSYLKLMLKNEVDESNYNQSIKSEYLNCEALKILKGHAIGSAKNKNSLGNELSTKLDLRSFSSSLSKVVNKDKNTLDALYPEETKSMKYETIYETEDWVFRLEVVAVIMLNDNKKQDWVVRLSDESKSGSFRHYSTIVIYDPGKQKKYVASSYP